MHRTNSFLLWTLTAIIAIGIMVYQRLTGPTYPKKVKIEFNGQDYNFKFLRSNEIGSSCDLNLQIEDPEVKAILFFKRYKVDEPWQEVIMQRKTVRKKSFFGKGEEISVLSATLPEQPPAGKLAYRINLLKGDQRVSIAADKPIVLRFKGFVPLFILIPHIIFMIISLFSGTRAGIEALFKGDRTFKFTKITLIAFAIGGLILGPVVQKYAFGELWAGWPFGSDWTDNKTVFAWVFWLVAFLVLKKKPKNRLWPVIAMMVLFAMYLIPHSMGGSELDNKTGKIETGIQN